MLGSIVMDKFVSPLLPHLLSFGSDIDIVALNVPEPFQGLYKLAEVSSLFVIVGLAHQSSVSENELGSCCHLIRGYLPQALGPLSDKARLQVLANARVSDGSVRHELNMLVAKPTYGVMNRDTVWLQVPVIKMVHAASGIPVDIAFNVDTGNRFHLSSTRGYILPSTSIQNNSGASQEVLPWTSQSCAPLTGLASSKRVAGYVVDYPCLKPLLIFLKHLLR